MYETLIFLGICVVIVNWYEKIKNYITNDHPKEYNFIEAELDSDPEFPGGMGVANEFVKEHIVYPEEAKIAGIQGVVKVLFDVSESGEIQNPSIKYGIGYGCDEVALKLIQSMPKWNPLIEKGVAKTAKCSFMVEFNS